MFNLLNMQRMTVYEERAQGDPVIGGSNGDNPLTVYKRAVDYSAPRYFRFSVQYDF